MQGMIHLYCGDGKGKTTAAMGLVIRALGQGLRAGIVQFLKNTPSGEILFLEKVPGVSILRGQDGTGFSFSMTPEQKANTRRIHNAHLEQARQWMLSGQYDLILLDEICAAYQLDLIDRDATAAFLREKPASVELILTGRDPAPLFIDAADYITEMTLRRHPFEKGISARRGIEF